MDSAESTTRRRSPFSVLYDLLRVKCRQLNIPWTPELSKDLPTKWEKHGDMVLLPENSFTLIDWRMLGKDLWPLVADCLKVKRIGRKKRIEPDDYRTPHIDLLYGDHGWVEHIDNHIRYQYDVRKCMFSIGNISEKIRIADLDCKDEVVVDMFAGIGYFTLPYLVHAGCKIVHACEWNPDAIEALNRNLEINNVADRCIVYTGDSRKVCPVGIAQRVNLGLLPTAHPYWLTACRALCKDGGMLHIHENIASAKAPSPPNSGRNRSSSGARKNGASGKLNRQSSLPARRLSLDTVYEMTVQTPKERSPAKGTPEPDLVNGISVNSTGNSNPPKASSSSDVSKRPPPRKQVSVDSSGYSSGSTDGDEPTTPKESKEMLGAQTQPLRDDLKQSEIAEITEDRIEETEPERPVRRKISMVILHHIDQQFDKPFTVKIKHDFVESWETSIDPAWQDWALKGCQEILRFLHNIHDEPWGGRIHRIGRVKRYAPHVDHIVMDFECKPMRLL